MPHYFFNVRNHINTIDFDGRELPSLDIAIEEALKDIVDIKRARFETLHDWPRWSIEICDHKRLPLRVVPFSSN